MTWILAICSFSIVMGTIATWRVAAGERAHHLLVLATVAGP